MESKFKELDAETKAQIKVLAAKIKSRQLKSADGSILLDSDLMDLIRLILSLFGVNLPPGILQIIELLLEIIFGDDD